MLQDYICLIKVLQSLLVIFLLFLQVVYKNNDVRLELSRLAKQGDPKMKIHGVVAFKCENVATLDPITFETPESFISLPKWNAKKTGSISFDFRTTEPNGLILFSHGKPRHQKDAKHPQMVKVDFFAIEMLDGHLYLLLDMGSGTIKIKALQKKVNDGEWYHVDFQRDGRSGKSSILIFIRSFLVISDRMLAICSAIYKVAHCLKSEGNINSH